MISRNWISRTPTRRRNIFHNPGQAVEAAAEADVGEEPQRHRRRVRTDLQP
jgi:hypothetical protein